MRFWTWTLAVGVGTLLSAVASAQTKTGESSELFPEYLNTIELTGGYTTEHNRHLTYGAVGFGHYLADNLAVIPQILGYNAVQGDTTAHMIGISVEGRLHFLTVERFSLYGEVAGGMLLGDKAFPIQGTDFNFTYQVGLGVSYHLSDNLDLLGRATFLHISNAYLNGANHNPAFNGWGGYLGLLWRL